jgi:DNA polymerase III alpha subunit
MNIDKYGNVILNSGEAFESLYSGRLQDFENIFLQSTADVDQFNLSVDTNADHIPKIQQYVEPNYTMEFADNLRQDIWYMPENYKTFDIENWLLNQVTDIVGYNRVKEELDLFAQHNMITLLKYLKYLVDTMRENKIVWGVGRGSSVASYVLYLIGVHKIDSIKYELDIKEFLK